MKYFVLAIVISLLYSSLGSAQTVLQGEVKQKVWTVNEARQEVLQGALQFVNVDLSMLQPLMMGYTQLRFTRKSSMKRGPQTLQQTIMILRAI